MMDDFTDQGAPGAISSGSGSDFDRAEAEGMVAAMPVALRRSVIESLYTEAMLLADEVRAYFESSGLEQRQTLDPLLRIGFSCESLKTTTRLMHIIAWLLTQRAINAGEITEAEARAHDRMLDEAVPSDAGICASLPDQARLLIVSSEQLYKRTLRLQEQFLQGVPPVDSPVHHLFARLSQAY